MGRNRDSNFLPPNQRLRNKLFDIYTRVGLTNLFDTNEDRKPITENILFIGDGPYSNDSFAEFLCKHKVINSLRFCKFNPESICTTIILGDNATYEDFIKAISFNREKKHPPTVYSQQLFMMKAFHGINVWRDESLLKRASLNNNLLYLLEYQNYHDSGKFNWKIFQIKKGSGTSKNDVWLPDKSPLGVLGYTAAKESKLSDLDRRKILNECFVTELSKLPQCDSPAYMHSWGQKESCERLIRIARIVAFCPPNTGIEAQNIKQNDLDYLKKNYYDKLFSEMQYSWPRIYNQKT